MEQIPTAKLPLEILHRIYYHCDFCTKVKLRETNKGIFAYLRWTSKELPTVTLWESCDPHERFFFRAVIRQDIETLLRHWSHVDTPARVNGLQLAVQWQSSKIALIFLYFKIPDVINDPNKRKELCQAGESLQTPTALAILKQSRENPSRKHHIFNRLLLGYTDQLDSLSENDYIFGLQLAVLFNNSRIAWLIFVNDRWDVDRNPEHRELVDDAKTLLIPAELAEVYMIKNSNQTEREFFLAVVGNRLDLTLADYDFNSSHWLTYSLDQLSGDTLSFGLQLAVRFRNRQATWMLLACIDKVDPSDREKGNTKEQDLIDEAKSLLTPRELAEIIKIHNGSSERTLLCRAIITKDYYYVSAWLDRMIYDELPLALLVAIRRGNVISGGELLVAGVAHFGYKLLSDTAAAAEDECEEYKGYWKMIRSSS